MSTIYEHDISHHELDTLVGLPDGTRVARLVYGDDRYCSTWYTNTSIVDVELCRSARKLSLDAEFGPWAKVEYRVIIRGQAQWSFDMVYQFGHLD